VVGISFAFPIAGAAVYEQLSGNAHWLGAKMVPDLNRGGKVMNHPVHPSAIKVKDLMATEVLSVSANATMHEAAEAMLNAHESAAVVLDEMGVCVGVISSRDFLGYEHAQGEAQSYIHGGVEFEFVADETQAAHIEDRPVDHVKRHMSPALQTIAADASALTASRYMIDENIHHLFVLDSTSRPVGALSAMQIMRCFMEHCLDEGESSGELI
jgi:CBS domain-containing protein